MKTPPILAIVILLAAFGAAAQEQGHDGPTAGDIVVHDARIPAPPELARTVAAYMDLTNGAPYSGVDNDTLWISDAAPAMDGYDYRCIISMLPMWNDTSAGAALTIDTIPTVSLGADSTFCPGDSIMLDAGAGFAAYLWNTGATTQTIQAPNATTYWAMVTDGNGCMGSDTMVTSHHTVTAPSLGGDQGNLSCWVIETLIC